MNHRSNYLGVILAAGRGSRMHDLCKHYPKPILPIGNKPIIVHQIELMRSLGIKEIVVLLGHKGFEISKVLGNGSHFGVSIKYVEQSDCLGIAHAVGQIEPYVHKPFLLFLGDIYFLADNIQDILQKFEQQGGGGVLATKLEDDMSAICRNYSIIQDSEGRVIRVIEKPRYVTNNLKGVGLYLFDLHIFDAIRRTPRTAMRNEYELTDSIQVFIDDGNYVGTANVVTDDLNVTYPSDLLSINLKILRDNDLDTLIGAGSDIHPDCQIINSVVGENVTIAEPCIIRDSMIFPFVQITSKCVVEKSIITPETTIRCNLRSEPHVELR